MFRPVHACGAALRSSAVKSLDGWARTSPQPIASGRIGDRNASGHVAANHSVASRSRSLPSLVLEMVSTGGDAARILAASGDFAFMPRASRTRGLVRLLRDNRRAIIDAVRKGETRPNRWRRLLAEKIETIVKMRGLPRPDAEAEAFRHIVVEYLNETLPNTDSRICAHCRGPNLPLTPTLPFGVGERHAWLHQGCADPWRAVRRKAAIEALAVMGIVHPPKDEAPQ